VKYRQLRNECTKLTRAEQMRIEVNKMKEGNGKVWQMVNKLTNPGKGGGVVIKENKRRLQQHSTTISLTRWDGSGREWFQVTTLWQLQGDKR
jgi:hypothetical protein